MSNGLDGWSPKAGVTSCACAKLVCALCKHYSLDTAVQFAVVSGQVQSPLESSGFPPSH